MQIQNEAISKVTGSSGPTKLSPLEQLQNKKKNHEEALVVINQAIEALQAYPEVTKVLDLLSQTGRF